MRKPDADPSHIAIYWGGAALVNSYEHRLLRRQDLLRAELPRSPKADIEWKVSRALLQVMPMTGLAFSLSHKLSHAVAVTAPRGWQVGIDLEKIRDRDVARLSAWMASVPEAETLAALPTDQALRHFYRLWTFKEAMIKARAQDFPGDLKTNTLARDPVSGQWRVDTPGDQGWALRVFECEPGWVLSVVWRAPVGEHADLAWHLVSDAPASAFELVIACGGEAPR